MIGMTDELFTGESISWIMVLPCFFVKDIIKLSDRARISVRMEPYFVSHEIHSQDGQPLLASAGQNYERYLTGLIFQGLI